MTAIPEWDNPKSVRLLADILFLHASEISCFPSLRNGQNHTDNYMGDDNGGTWILVDHVNLSPILWMIRIPRRYACMRFMCAIYRIRKWKALHSSLLPRQIARKRSANLETSCKLIPASRMPHRYHRGDLSLR